VKKKNVLIAVLVFGIVNSLRRLTNNIFKSNPAMTINPKLSPIVYFSANLRKKQLNKMEEIVHIKKKLCLIM
jgi:hypothetical protein